MKVKEWENCLARFFVCRELNFSRIFVDVKIIRTVREYEEIFASSSAADTAQEAT